MEAFDKQTHWENIYNSRKTDEVSWYEQKPAVSLNFIKEFAIPKNAKIIDIGGGESYFADCLLEAGYSDITVLDISATAIRKAQSRLGKKAEKIKWIVADAAHFSPEVQYDFWHDRAAFHFLTTESEIKNYVKTVHQNLHPSGILVIGTFSENGPNKCSGITVKQYSEDSMAAIFKDFLTKIKCKVVDHITPSKAIQNFIFCSFKKSENLHSW